MAQRRAPSVQRTRPFAERLPLAGYLGGGSSTLSSGRNRVRSADVPCSRGLQLGTASRGLSPSLLLASGGIPKPVLGSASERLNLARKSTTPLPRPEVLLEEDCSEYSDRFLPGYDRGRLLGRGACAVVWLATPSGGQRQHAVAVKQVAKGTTGKKRSDTDSARKEIFFGSYLFHPGGEPKFSAAQCPGMRHIARLIEYSETKRDIWLVMEYGGTSLTKMAYEIKGEFHRGERVYRVHHLPLLQAMKQNPAVLKSLMRQLLSALVVLADHRIVHSDIKPDNILVEEDERHRLRARFIDLGSAYGFESPDSVAVATPEYMPPEALEACAARNGSLGGSSARLSGLRVPPRKGPEGALKVQRPSQPWSFDIWSLGSILLELCLGAPLWLSYKCRVADDQRTTTGLFGVPGRDAEKIMLRQTEALRQKGLQGVLRGALGVPLNNEGEGSGQELLSLMLAWEPLDRICPRSALEHPFLQEGTP